MNQFQEKKYVAVKDILSQDVVNIATQYALLDELNNYTPEPKDKQVPDAHSRYADQLMECILMHVKPKLEYVTGLELIPTYSYYRVYRPGQELKPHVDRESCEISTTISFGRNYQGKDYSWPMFVEGTPLHLEPGDAIVYRGCEAEHWREKFEAPDMSYHVQGFFHFVNANGPYTEFALDGRPYIGQPKYRNMQNLPNKSYILPA